MNAEEYSYICDLVHARSGIALSADKQYLVESRILPVARRRGFASIAELVQKHKTVKDEDTSAEITEAMTTNETFFFRDSKPFDQFRQIILPTIAKNIKGNRVRIWSAACSSGQEAYSIGMCIREDEAKYPMTSYEIVGTDLSAEIVKRASTGVYSQFEVQRGLPIQMLMKYFEKDSENWRVRENVKSMVNFRTGNLLLSYDSLGKFDYILCRNVLIYFNDATKKDILERMARLLNPWGMLVLGASETILGITDKLQQVADNRGLYELKK